jgi:hypothetical protein
MNAVPCGVCGMQCKELEAVLESEDLDSLPTEAREHLAGCSCCQDFLADLSAIVVAAKAIPAEVTPPDRIWVSLRAQLEAEGIIRDAEPVVTTPSAPWWQGLSALFRPRALAAASAGFLVIVGSIYVVEHRNTENVAQNPPPVQASVPADKTAVPASPAPVEENRPLPAKKPPAPLATSAQLATSQGPQPSTTALKASPSEDIYLGESASVLDQTESSLPRRELTNNAVVDAALRKNLRTLNEFIAECQARLKQNPDDQLTREYLNMAYQQKAELLTAMLDSGRSEH